MILLGVHVLVYLKRALISSKEDMTAATRAHVPGARARTYLVAFSIVTGVVVGLATLPADHHWLHLPNKDHHREGQGLLLGREHDRHAAEVATPRATV